MLYVKLVITFGGERVSQALGQYLKPVQNTIIFQTWFSRHGGVGLVVELDDLRGLFQP